MKISTYYRNARCEKMAELDAFKEDSRNHIFAKVVIQVCERFCHCNVTREQLLSDVAARLSEAYPAMLETAFPWRIESMVKQDTEKVRRLLNWLEHNKLRPVECLLKVGVTLEDNAIHGIDSLTGMVHLIVSAEDGHHEVLIIHAGTCTRSIKGHNVHTRADGDLNALVAKIALEEKYPGVVVDVVYLSHETDGERTELGDLRVNDTKNSNMHRLTFPSFYNKEGVFDRAAAMGKISEVLKTPRKEKCEDCRYYSFCKTPLLYEETPVETAVEAVAESGKGYVVPSFTEDQMIAVNHVEGPLLVCAGPGSGKTATLIGRIKYLIEEIGIMPEFILVVTFTNEAANELRNRCLSFLSEDNLPTIATLNGFCYGILKEQKHLLKNGLKVLSSRAQLEIIRELVSVLPKQLSGFKYGMEYGKNGLYKTILNRMNAYKESADEFFFKNPDIVRKEFADFVEMYDLAIREGGYITFDQQISYVNLLFQMHPEILECYQSIYQYIMVDEYQDVNEEQVQLLYSLAGERKNLVAVGDDDQNIYAFRGGKAEFMLNFCKDMGGAKKVVLRDNFRSTKTLVEASSNLIKLNKDRIDKEIRSGKKDVKKELLPVLVPTMDNKVTEEIIKGLLEEGYSYGDIAIISPQNAPLVKLHKEINVPSVLAKSYLCNDAFFLLIYNVLKLYFNQEDDMAFYQYLRLYGCEVPTRENGVSLLQSTCLECGIECLEDVAEGVMKDVPYVRALNDLYSCFLLVAGNNSLYEFLDTISLMYNWHESDVVERLTDEIRNNSLRTPEDLFQYMQEMVLFEDDTRVDVAVGNRVLLITSHDSKGKEFPIVILRNEFFSSKKKDGKVDSENTRRLFYVATTRAKEQLFILQDADCSEDFGSQIPHVKMEV